MLSGMPIGKIIIEEYSVVGIQLEFQALSLPDLVADFAGLVFGTVARVDECTHFGGGFLGHNHNGHKRSFFK